MRVPWCDREWRRVGVHGLGLSGLAAARLLRTRGVEVVGFDRRPAGELSLGDLRGDSGFTFAGAEPERLPEGLDGLVVSPGVAHGHPLPAAARRAGLPVVAEVELAFVCLDGPLVGITGSNGKSTTTAMTGALVAAGGRAVEVCGNIGRPLSECVAGSPGRVFVTELSSFQLEGVATLRPVAGAFLNLAADHLDRHGDGDTYLAAKRRLFECQEADDVAVLNADDPVVNATPVRSRRRLFSRTGPVEDGCWLDGDAVVEAGGEADGRVLFRRRAVPLPGPHNLENAMAAALLALAVGVDGEALEPALSAFRGLPHRLERVAEIRGVAFFDDSKGTNPAATLRSLEGFPDGAVHLILGGRSKGAEFESLRPLARRKAARVYLVGESAPAIARGLGDSVPWEISETVARAVAAAAERARPGEVVLLSPACASFDQYSDFMDRGRDFQRRVRSLAGGAHGQEARL